MTFSRDDPRTRVTFRVSEQFKADIDAYAEEHGQSISDVCREAVEKWIGQPRDKPIGVTPPSEPELAEAWELLNQLAGTRGRIDQEEALPLLAQETQLPKPLARRKLVKPLEQRGYVKVVPQMDRVEYRLRRHFDE